MPKKPDKCISTIPAHARSLQPGAAFFHLASQSGAAQHYHQERERHDNEGDDLVAFMASNSAIHALPLLMVL